jgi:tetratricopeptide (TPR) repeat protein
MIKQLILCSLLLLQSGFLVVRAQTPAEPISAQSDHTQEASVVELVSTKLTFENDGTSTQETKARVHIQSDAGVQSFGLLTFGYQGATQTVEIDDVHVQKLDGTVVTTPPDNIQDLDAGITRAAPFYSDLREKHVAVKGLSAGDTLEYQVRWHMTKPLAPGQFWYEGDFEQVETVLDERLQISVPRDRPLKMKSPLFSPVVTEEGGRRIYTWKTANLKDRSSENEGGALDTALGRLRPPDVQLSSFQSWDEVGRWYGGLQQERVQPSPEIRAKAADLTKGATETASALHTIYDYVSTKFRYIGVAFGIGRYQPHSAADVLSNQYGDCKDKHTLLASLLQAAGVTAYPALISTTHKLDPDVPSPAQFDHVISVIPQGKDFLWLDTTTEVGPFGYLSISLRDKQALVIPNDKPAMLLTTPSDPPFQSSLTFKIDGKLNDNGTLDAKMEHTSRGDSEVMLRSAFRQVQQSQWKELIQGISYNLGFAGTVSDVSASAPEATGEPFRFSYTYNRKDYPDWSTHQITVPGLSFAMPQVKDDEAHSKDPIWLGPPTEISSDSKVELPPGYAPELPMSVILVRDYAEYHASYTQDHGVLISQRRMVIKLREVPSGERDDYKKFTKSVLDDANRYIVLLSSSASSRAIPTVQDPGNSAFAAALRSLPDSSNAEAREFEKVALNAMGPDQDAALNALKQAVVVDPKFTRGWITLGSLYMSLSKTDSGLDALRKAIDSDPQQPISYKTLAFALASLNHPDEAIKVWQNLLKVVPDDLDGPSNLAALLFRTKRYSEAVPILEAAVKANPSNVAPLSRLGVAYLRSGQEEKGVATFQDVLKIDASPASLNNVAYELAEANVKLSEALGYAEKAVHEQEDASQKIQLANLVVDDLAGTQKLGSYWDTLGWVHYRLGHFEQAEKYLLASWQLSQEAVVADHLGQVREQAHEKDAAIHIYRLALSAAETGGPGIDRAQIQEHLSRLLPGVKLSTGFDLHRGNSTSEELSRMRTVKLPRIVSGTASAEFFLLFGPGAKLEAVKFISGSDKLNSAEKAIRGAVFPISYPDGSTARLVRRAILACSPLSGCEIVLYNPDSVHTLD